MDKNKPGPGSVTGIGEEYGLQQSKHTVAVSFRSVPYCIGEVIRIVRMLITIGIWDIFIVDINIY